MWGPIGLRHCDEEFIAILEVAVDRSGRHSGAVSDILHSRMFIAHLPNEFAGRFEELGAWADTLVAFGRRRLPALSSAITPGSLALELIDTLFYSMAIVPQDGRRG